MTKIEYMTAIESNLTAAEALCADLRKLRILGKLAKEIPGSETLVSFEALDKAVEDKEVALKATRAELGKARRIVKKFEAIEGLEAEGTQPSEETAAPVPEAKPVTKGAGKKKVKAEVAAATDNAEGVTVEIGQAS